MSGDQKRTTGAGSAVAARPAIQRGGGGAIPTTALQSIRIAPISFSVASVVVSREHYLQAMAGGTQICLGVFVEKRLLGVMTFGAGPTNAHRLVDGAKRADCLCLTRFWLSDVLPANSESRVLGIALGNLRRHTDTKFVVSYADPAAGHIGTIYQATNWLYTGTSERTPLLDFGDGVPRHTRTVAHNLGTHSAAHFAAHGITVEKVPQVPKHRYILFLDRTWQPRLRVGPLPYPKRAESNEAH